MECRVKSKYGVTFLVLAALISVSTAIAHMSCIFLGPECFAPAQIIESARDGTWLSFSA
jgi:hypothetical protein